MVENIFKSILRRKRKKRLSGEINPEDIFLDSSNLAGLDMDKMEGALHKPIPSVAERIPFFILLFIFSLFTFRLYTLEVANYDLYRNKADDNRYNTHLILANRGQILDRNGKILANNIVSSSSEILKRQYLEDSGISNLIVLEIIGKTIIKEEMVWSRFIKIS
jgi:hypothetical protein